MAIPILLALCPHADNLDRFGVIKDLLFNGNRDVPGAEAEVYLEHAYLSSRVRYISIPPHTAALRDSALSRATGMPT
jgi:hypothetical protein